MGVEPPLWVCIVSYDIVPYIPESKLGVRTLQLCLATRSRRRWEESGDETPWVYFLPKPSMPNAECRTHSRVDLVLPSADMLLLSPRPQLLRPAFFTRKSRHVGYLLGMYSRKLLCCVIHLRGTKKCLTHGGPVSVFVIVSGSGLLSRPKQWRAHDAQPGGVRKMRAGEVGVQWLTNVSGPAEDSHQPRPFHSVGGGLQWERGAACMPPKMLSS